MNRFSRRIKIDQIAHH